MGKALDTLHDAIVEIEQDGENFPNKDFMCAIFNGIGEENEPPEPLVDFVNFMFGKSSFRLYIV